MAQEKEMLLGSGDLYIAAYTGTIPENEEIETEDNRIGGIKGGATLTYKPTIYSTTDDMRRMKKSLITAEEATFKSGFLSFDLGEIAKLCLGAVFTSSDDEDTLEVGGGMTIQQYVLRFVHTMDTGLKVRTTMIGTPSNGFELAFNPEKESTTNAEFSAAPMNSKGRLFKISKEKVSSLSMNKRKQGAR